jgi:hypothetical protein
MTPNVTQGLRASLARVGRHIAGITAECNYAQYRLTSLRDTPGAYLNQAPRN